MADDGGALEEVCLSSDDAEGLVKPCVVYHRDGRIWPVQ